MDIKNNRSVEFAFDQWLKSKNLRLFNSYDAMDMHIKGAMLATWQDAIALVSKKLSLLLCDEHLQKCESTTGIFNTQYPDEEPCLICLTEQAKAKADLEAHESSKPFEIDRDTARQKLAMMWRGESIEINGRTVIFNESGCFDVRQNFSSGHFSQSLKATLDYLFE